MSCATVEPICTIPLPRCKLLAVSVLSGSTSSRGRVDPEARDVPPASPTLQALPETSVSPVTRSRGCVGCTGEMRSRGSRSSPEEQIASVHGALAVDPIDTQDTVVSEAVVGGRFPGR